MREQGFPLQKIEIRNQEQAIGQATGKAKRNSNTLQSPRPDGKGKTAKNHSGFASA
jgi:hypothetical protein